MVSVTVTWIFGAIWNFESVLVGSNWPIPVTIVLKLGLKLNLSLVLQLIWEKNDLVIALLVYVSHSCWYSCSPFTTHLATCWFRYFITWDVFSSISSYLHRYWVCLLIIICVMTDRSTTDTVQLVHIVNFYL